VNLSLKRAIGVRRALGLVFIGGVLAAVSGQPASPQFPPAPGTGPGLPETIEAIDSAPVTTRILYITAHPGDESATLPGSGPARRCGAADAHTRRRWTK